MSEDDRGPLHAHDSVRARQRDADVEGSRPAPARFRDRPSLTTSHRALISPLTTADARRVTQLVDGVVVDDGQSFPDNFELP